MIAVSEMGNIGFLTGNSAGLLDELIQKTHEQGGKFILMSVSLPYDVARFQEADAIMITYGARSMNLDPRTDTEPMKRYGPNMAAALYLMLQDKETPKGKLPVNLPELNDNGDGYNDKVLYARGTGLIYPEKEKYSGEWVKGLWYNKDGTQTYAYKGSWKKDSKGWWLGKNCSLTDNTCYKWHKDSRGWWYGVTGGWYAKNAVYIIDGKKYSFDKKGYCTNP